MRWHEPKNVSANQLRLFAENLVFRLLVHGLASTFLHVHVLLNVCPKLNRFSLTANSAVAWNGLLPFFFGGMHLVEWTSTGQNPPCTSFKEGLFLQSATVKPQDTHYGHCGGLVLQVPSPQKNLQIRSISCLRCLAQAKSCFRIPTKFKTSFRWKKLRNVRFHCVEPTCSSSTCMTSLFEKFFARLHFCSRWTEVNRTRSLVNTHGNNVELRPKISSTLKFRSHVLLRCILTSIVFVMYLCYFVWFLVPTELMAFIDAYAVV